MDKGSVMVDGHAPEFQDWSARIEDPALQFELRNVLIAALDSLPEHYRAIVALRHVEGLSPQDVSRGRGFGAASSGRSTGTAPRGWGDSDADDAAAGGEPGSLPGGSGLEIGPRSIGRTRPPHRGVPLESFSHSFVSA